MRVGQTIGLGSNARHRNGPASCDTGGPFLFPVPRPLPASPESAIAAVCPRPGALQRPAEATAETVCPRGLEFDDGEAWNAPRRRSWPADRLNTGPEPDDGELRSSRKRKGRGLAVSEAADSGVVGHRRGPRGATGRRVNRTRAQLEFGRLARCERPSRQAKSRSGAELSRRWGAMTNQNPIDGFSYVDGYDSPQESSAEPVPLFTGNIDARGAWRVLEDRVGPGDELA
jgi:hypothetical protein